MSLKRNMTEMEAKEWAEGRWGSEVRTETHSHPTSIGDQIAILYLHLVGDQDDRWYRGIGYSGMAPLGVSMWTKAAEDLLRQEPRTNVEVQS